MDGFLAVLAAICLGAAMSWILASLLLRDERTRGRPRFSASRYRRNAGSYVVRVVHDGGSRVRAAKCTLLGVDKSTTHADLKFGDVSTIRYYPSLGDETPTHVEVTWSKWKKSYSELVEII
jgi:hypothetical protein